MSFAKSMGKNLSITYGQKLLDCAKISTTHTLKTASKRALQKTAEATGDLIGNKIADKITSVSKKSSAHSKKLENDHTNDELEAPKKYSYLQKKGKELLMN